MSTLSGDQAKINELIKASNRQERAILLLAESIENGEWLTVSQEVGHILYGEDSL